MKTWSKAEEIYDTPKSKKSTTNDGFIISIELLTSRTDVCCNGEKSLTCLCINKVKRGTLIGKPEESNVVIPEVSCLNASNIDFQCIFDLLLTYWTIRHPTITAGASGTKAKVFAGK